MVVKWVEIESVVKAIKDEPVLDGQMPDDMYETLKNSDKDTMSELLRIIVRQTKDNIESRVRGLLWGMKS